MVRIKPLVKGLLFLVLAAVAVLGYLFLLNILKGKLGAFSTTVPAVLLALAVLVLNWRFFRSEGSSLVDVGLETSVFRSAQGISGLVVGAVVVGIWMLALAAITPVVWRAVPGSFTAAVGAITFAIANNLAEELVYRSYLFMLLTRAYNATVAAIATSVLFTLLHFQAGVPLPNVIAVVLTSALVYAAFFRHWRSVPLVLGVHVGMNFMQELCGLRHSGLTAFLPTYAHTANAKESSLVLCAIAIINMALAITVWATTPKPQTASGQVPAA